MEIINDLEEFAGKYIRIRRYLSQVCYGLPDDFSVTLKSLDSDHLFRAILGWLSHKVPDEQTYVRLNKCDERHTSMHFICLQMSRVKILVEYVHHVLSHAEHQQYNWKPETTFDNLTIKKLTTVPSELEKSTAV